MRTQHLIDEFAKSFHQADVVYVLDIYAASERPIEGVTSTALVQVCLWAASSRSNSRAKWLMHATVLHIPVLLGLMVFDKIPR